MITEAADFDLIDVTGVTVDGVFAPHRTGWKRGLLMGEDVAWILEGLAERTAWVCSFFRCGPLDSDVHEGPEFVGDGGNVAPFDPTALYPCLHTPSARFRDAARARIASMFGNFTRTDNGGVNFHNWGNLWNDDHYVIDSVAHGESASVAEYFRTLGLAITPQTASMSADFTPLTFRDLQTMMADINAAETVAWNFISAAARGAMAMRGGTAHTIWNGTETTTPFTALRRPSWSYSWMGSSRYEQWDEFDFRPSVLISGARRPDGTWTDPRITTTSRTRAWMVMRVALVAPGASEIQYRFLAKAFDLDNGSDVEVEPGVLARSLRMPSSWCHSRTLAMSVLDVFGINKDAYDSVTVMPLDEFIVDTSMNYRANYY